MLVKGAQGGFVITRSLFSKHNTLQWRHNGLDSVSNHQPLDCSLNCLFRLRSKKTSKLHITGLCEGNSSVTGEFPSQKASNAEKVSIWWRHHEIIRWYLYYITAVFYAMPWYNEYRRCQLYTKACLCFSWQRLPATCAALTVEKQNKLYTHNYVSWKIHIIVHVPVKKPWSIGEV